MKISPWPQFSSDEIKAVNRVLTSGKVNRWTGSETSFFEKEFAENCGTKYAIALANGSLALTAAYKSLGLKAGDELITTSRTFIATASCAAMLGVKIIFADVDKNSGAITAESIKPLISKKTKAISVVHLGGWPANMDSICNLAKTYNLYVVEDCSQAHGAFLKINGKEKSVGSFGDIATWSFCQDKIMTTGGEGGMIATNNNKLWEYIFSLKDHGKNFESLSKKVNSSSYKSIYDDLGTNYRLTELQSAIGRIQLSKLEKTIEIRTRNALILYDNLKSLASLRIPMPDKNIKHAWYKFYCFIKPAFIKKGWCRDKIINEIMSFGYPAFSGSCSEIYLEKCFVDLGYFPTKRLPVAKELGESSLMFLVHPTITEVQMYEYAQIIKRTILEATLQN